MSIKVYVIVPVFNIETYIDKCVRSILNQYFLNMEIVLVDDGSTDECYGKCDYYKYVDKRIVVIHKKNGGLSSARNAGLDYIKDKEKGYVVFIDGDDWVEPHYLEELIKKVTSVGADIVCSSFFYGNDTSHCHNNIDEEKSILSLEATNILLRDKTVQSHAWSKIFKTELWFDLRFDESISYMEDQSTMYKVFYSAKKIYVSNYSGYHYRQDNNNSLTKSRIDNKKALSGLKAYYSPCFYEGFKKEDKEYLLPSIQNALVNAYLMLLPYYKPRRSNVSDRNFVNELKKYIKTNKLIKKFIPDNKKSAVKKKIYRLCPFMYPLFFRIAKGIMNWLVTK